MTFHADDSRVSWGRVVRARHYVTRPRFADEIADDLRVAVAEGRTVLPVGLGRAYGDSNLNPDGALLDITGLDRIIAFDDHAGVLRVEGGASLSSVLRLCVPRGWFASTVPGTRFVTIGGAIANDVHGKNHQHAGSFGCSVRRIGLARSDGSVSELSPTENAELFAATIGGLGLTGVIVWAEIQLARIPSAFIDQEVIPFGALHDFFSIAGESASSEYTVSWIDCTARGARLGRGFFTRGNWAEDGDLTPHPETLKVTVPVEGSSVAFNPLALRALNTAYDTAARVRARKARVHYAASLFPLDAIGRWNRLYGAKGFYQYQCVIPPAQSRDAIAALLEAVSNDGAGSILVVLKTFGEKTSPGLLSFPMPGATLAMDFVNAGDRTLRLFARLDDIVREAGGRLYPAKDGRIPKAMFESGYEENRRKRFAAAADPAFSSSFWRRVST